MKENGQEYWNSVANTWEKFGDLNRHVEKYVESKLNEYIDSGEINNLLNLGSGGGDRYLSTFGDKVIHVDYAANMLKANQYGGKVEADARHHLPISSNSIDISTSFFLMRYLSLAEQISLVNEIVEVLSPHGLLIVIDVPDNKHQFQVCEFKPELLLPHIDMRATILEAETETQNVGKYISTGFGGWYERGSYKISSLILKKL